MCSDVDSSALVDSLLEVVELPVGLSGAPWSGPIRHYCYCWKLGQYEGRVAVGRRLEVDWGRDERGVRIGDGPMRQGADGANEINRRGSRSRWATWMRDTVVGKTGSGKYANVCIRSGHAG